MIPPMPENNKANIPKINNFKILGSSNKCASQRTPNVKPRKNVYPYRSGPLINS